METPSCMNCLKRLPHDLRSAVSIADTSEIGCVRSVHILLMVGEARTSYVQVPGPARVACGGVTMHVREHGGETVACIDVPVRACLGWSMHQVDLWAGWEGAQGHVAIRHCPVTGSCAWQA